MILLAGGLDYPMPGYPGKHVSKQFWGDIQLAGGGSLHARIFGSFSGMLLEDLLAELAPLIQDDVIVTNFGAWYPQFVKKVLVLPPKLKPVSEALLYFQSRHR